VHEDVVDERAVRCHERAVVNLAVREPRDVVRGEALEGFEGSRPLHDDLAHVADVEQAARVGRRVLLVTPAY
jgi:hypothetical protein